MREITVSAYNAIEAERNSLQEEMVGLRRRNAELEKEARRAATLERELEREQRLHAQRKERHQAAVVETGRLDQKVREQAAYIRSLEDDVSRMEILSKEREHALKRANAAEREQDKLQHQLSLARETESELRRELQRLYLIESKHTALKEALK